MVFLLMISDLKASGVDLWKYVDDTTESEVIKKGQRSQIQSAINHTAQWSNNNKLHFHPDKCKELRFCFTRKASDPLEPVIIDNTPMEVVKEYKILGLTISDDRKWNIHVNNIIKKVASRMYFLAQLKRAEVGYKDLVNSTSHV